MKEHTISPDLFDPDNFTGRDVDELFDHFSILLGDFKAPLQAGVSSCRLPFRGGFKFNL